MKSLIIRCDASQGKTIKELHKRVMKSKRPTMQGFIVQDKHLYMTDGKTLVCISPDNFAIPETKENTLYEVKTISSITIGLEIIVAEGAENNYPKLNAFSNVNNDAKSFLQSIGSVQDVTSLIIKAYDQFKSAINYEYVSCLYAGGKNKSVYRVCSNKDSGHIIICSGIGEISYTVMNYDI